MAQYVTQCMPVYHATERYEIKFQQGSYTFSDHRFKFIPRFKQLLGSEFCG
jgi:hypothetical protein